MKMPVGIPAANTGSNSNPEIQVLFEQLAPEHFEKLRLALNSIQVKREIKEEPQDTEPQDTPPTGTDNDVCEIIGPVVDGVEVKQEQPEANGQLLEGAAANARVADDDDCCVIPGFGFIDLTDDAPNVKEEPPDSDFFQSLNGSSADTSDITVLFADTTSTNSFPVKCEIPSPPTETLASSYNELQFNSFALNATAAESASYPLLPAPSSIPSTPTWPNLEALGLDSRRASTASTLMEADQQQEAGEASERRGVKRKYNKFSDSVGGVLEFLAKKVRGELMYSEPDDVEYDVAQFGYEPCFVTAQAAADAGATMAGSGSAVTTVAVDQRPPRQSAEDLRRTMRKKMFRCRVCKNRFIERDIFERHLKERHPNQYEKYMDEKAVKEEKDRLRYLEYLRVKQIREDRKNQRLADIYEMRLKLQAQGQEVGPPPLPQEIFPPMQKRTPQQQQQAAEKLRKQIRVSPQCVFCDKRYRNDIALKKHIAKRHPACINYVQCNRCYQACRNVDELQRHHCDLTFICTQCFPPRNLTTRERLYNHQQKFHSGEQPGHPCDECGQRFLSLRRLERHKRMDHIVQKPYKCQFCDEYFPTDMAVCIHERVHTGRVRWECDICDYKTNRKTKIVDHKRLEHGYLCMSCGAATEDWNKLKEHTLRDHQGYLTNDNQNASTFPFGFHVTYFREP